MFFNELMLELTIAVEVMFTMVHFFCKGRNSKGRE